MVDDATNVRKVIKLMLEYSNYQVVGEAENGFMAVEKYQELRPDLVVMDITMAGLDGISALKEILKYDSQAAVIMISAFPGDYIVQEVIEAGAKAFISKPFLMEDFIAAVQRLNPE